MPHNCAVPGCNEQVSDKLLMCLPHWKLVPQLVQLTVNQTWQRMNRVNRCAPGVRLVAIRKYQDAKAAAIAAVAKKGAANAHMGL